MKKNIILVALLAAAAALLSSCESATAAESMSLKPAVEEESSSSMDEISSSSMEELSSSSIPSSSSLKELSSSSNINSSGYSAYESFYGETGKVCDEWEIKVVPASEATQGYLSMVQACGVQEILNTGNTPSFNIGHWLSEKAPITDGVRSLVVKDINSYGLSFRVFIADDGSLHYVYVEPYRDGMGLK